MHPIYLFNYLNSIRFNIISKSTTTTTRNKIDNNNNDMNSTSSAAPPAYYDLSYITIPYEPLPPFTLTSLNYNSMININRNQEVETEEVESLLDFLKEDTRIREKHERWNDEKVSMISALDMDCSSSNNQYNLKKG